MKRNKNDERDKLCKSNKESKCPIYRDLKSHPYT